MTQILALIISLIFVANAPISGFGWNLLILIGAFHVAEIVIDFAVEFLQALSAAFLKATTKEAE